MISTTAQVFGGDKKKGQSILGPVERRFIDKWVKRIPWSVKSWHLTMTTLLWSLGTIGFGALARTNPVWLFAISAMVILQWFTDSFDGTLGKTRGEGLVKWGFFMDHFLDTIFAGSLVVAYSLIGPTEVRIGYVAMNTIVYVFGTQVIAWGLPLVLIANLVVLVGLVYQTQKRIWYLDQAAKLTH